MKNNKNYKQAMELLGTTNILRTFFLFVKWVLNPSLAIKMAKNISDNIPSSGDNNSKIIAIGYLNEFFSKYLEFGKSPEEVIKLNSQIDRREKTKNKIANALIELRGIRQKLKAASKTTDDQLVQTINSFGVSQGIVRGIVLNFKDTAQKVPKGCIGIFPTSGVKYTTQFLKCVGIIFQNGSVTSHGAILAREAKIPAIVSPTITIKDNETVEINGITGTVKRVVDRGN